VDKYQTASAMASAMDHLREVARWLVDPYQFIDSFDPHAEFKKAMEILNEVTF
jgi:hypothetical protein